MTNTAHLNTLYLFTYHGHDDIVIGENYDDLEWKPNAENLARLPVNKETKALFLDVQKRTIEKIKNINSGHIWRLPTMAKIMEDI